MGTSVVTVSIQPSRRECGRIMRLDGMWLALVQLWACHGSAISCQLSVRAWRGQCPETENSELRACVELHTEP